MIVLQSYILFTSLLFTLIGERELLFLQVCRYYDKKPTEKLKTLL